MSKESYRDYLQSEHWKQVKLDWYSHESNRMCKFCGSADNLDIHHKRYRTSYRSVLGRENTRPSQHSKCDLITLCRTCHFTYHDVMGKHATLTMNAIRRIKNLMKTALSVRDAINIGLRKKAVRKRLLKVVTAGET